MARWLFEQTEDGEFRLGYGEMGAPISRQDALRLSQNIMRRCTAAPAGTTSATDASRTASAAAPAPSGGGKKGGKPR